MAPKLFAPMDLAASNGPATMPITSVFIVKKLSSLPHTRGAEAERTDDGHLLLLEVRRPRAFGGGIGDDHGDDLVVHQFRGGRHGLRRVAFSLLEEDLDGVAVDPTMVVRPGLPGGSHLVDVGLAGRGDTLGVGEKADLDHRTGRLGCCGLSAVEPEPLGRNRRRGPSRPR